LQFINTYTRTHACTHAHTHTYTEDGVYDEWTTTPNTTNDQVDGE